MQLTLKQYRIIKLVIVFILAVSFTQLIVLKSFFWPIALLAVSSLFLIYLRKKVKGILADERDYITAGKSALLAIQIYSWIAVVAMFLLYASTDLNPHYEAIAITLAFSVCILMILYSFIFRYYNKVKFSDKKIIFIIIASLIFIAMVIFTLRVFSGEDGWICQDGQWQKHGNPSFSAPTVECKL